jgi:phage shock protein A
LQAKVDLLRQQLSDTQSELQKVRSEAVSISSKVKPVRQQLAKANVAKEKAAAVLEEAQVTALIILYCTVQYSTVQS